MATDVLVSEFMSSPVTMVDVDANFFDVVTVMRQKNISCVLASRNGVPMGMLTERDVVQCLVDHLPDTVAQVRVREFMNSPIITTREDATLFEATVLCRSQKVKHLPVVNAQEELVGVITYSDLVAANQVQLERRAAIFGGKGGDSVESLNEQLLQMTLTDPLMGIGNRRSMEIDLLQTEQLSFRYKRPFSILLIDIDYFKAYNDYYGHLAGDQCLKQFADLTKSTIRGCDRVYRYGGEELLLLLPETRSEGAEVIANRLIASIAAAKISHEKSPLGFLTASVGIFGNDMRGNDVEKISWKDMVNRADEALYEAKGQGRNRVILFSAE